MKKVLFLSLSVLFFSNSSFAQKEELIKIIDSYKTIDFEESKEYIKNNSLGIQSLYDIMSYNDISGIVFDTDTSLVLGYKALFNCKIKNKSGQYIDKKMIAVMLKNSEKGKWKLYLLRESLDPTKSYNSVKNDINNGEFYTKKQYVYRNAAYWSIAAGKIKDAISFLELSKKEAEIANDENCYLSDFYNTLNAIL